MITMSIPTQLPGSSAVPGEGLPSADTSEQSAGDFADLLAAAFAPVAAPNMSELLSTATELATTASVPTDLAATTSLPATYSVAIPSDQQSDFRSSWALPLPTELSAVPVVSPQHTNEAALLPTPPLVQASEAAANAAPTFPLTAARPDAALPPTPNPVVTSFTVPTGTKLTNVQLTVTEPVEPGKSFSLTEFQPGNDLPARAARAVKDIVAEPEAIEPTAQTDESQHFADANPTPDAAPEMLLAESANTASASEAQFAITTPSLHAASSAPTATASDKGAAHSIVTQTIHPLVELAHQTAHREARSLRFDLHPKELGRVEVELARDGAGNVSATLNTEQADAAQTLTQSLGQLREALEQAGVKVEQLQVFTSAQFQQHPNGQPQQQPNERTTALEALLPELTTEESTATVEEEKLLNLRA